MQTKKHLQIKTTNKTKAPVQKSKTETVIQINKSFTITYNFFKLKEQIITRDKDSSILFHPEVLEEQEVTTRPQGKKNNEADVLQNHGQRQTKY